MMARLTSIGLFVCVGGLVTYAVLDPSAESSSPEQFSPMLFYEVQAGQTIDLVVPASAGRLKVVSIGIIEPDAAGEINTLPDIAYGFRMQWLDPDGQIVLTEELAERAGVRPVSPHTPRRQIHAFIPGSVELLSDVRLTFVPGNELLPRGGVLRLQSLRGNPRLLVRIFFEQRRDTLAVRRSAITPTRRDRRTVERRTHIPSWSYLTLGERQEVLSRQWRSAEVVAVHAMEQAQSDSHRTRRVMLNRARVDRKAAEAASQALAPGRAVAFNFVGPLTVWLSGGASVGRLLARVVAAVPDVGGTSTPARMVPDTPLGFLGETHAWKIEINQQGPVALHLENPDTEEAADSAVVHFLLSVPGAHRQALVGNDVALPAGRIMSIGIDTRKHASDQPGHPGHPDHLVLMPQWTHLRLYTAGGGEGSRVTYEVGGLVDEPLRITLRAVGRRARDVQRRDVDLRIELREVDAQGRSVGSFHKDLQLTLSRYETLTDVRGNGRVLSEAIHPDPILDPTEARRSRLVSEPLVIYYVGGRGASRLEITADVPIAVSASVYDGPGSARNAIRQLPTGLRSRYGLQPGQTWSRLTAANEEAMRSSTGAWSTWGRSAMLTANVRLDLEPREEETSPADPRTYSSLRPTSSSRRVTGQVWLVPHQRRNRPLHLYCGYAPRNEAQPFADSGAGSLSDPIKGIIWTPTPALGQHFTIALDDSAGEIRSLRDRLHQRVTPITMHRTRQVRSVRFRAPPGAYLWLRTFGTGTGCPRPHRPVRVYPLEPQETMQVVARKTMHRQLITIGGLASVAVDVRLRLDEGELKRRGGILDACTVAERVLSLDVTDASATPVADPNRPARVLKSTAVRLAEDLANGNYSVELQNLGETLAFFWLGLETSDIRGIAETTPDLRWTTPGLRWTTLDDGAR